MTRDEIERLRALCEAATRDGWSNGGKWRNAVEHSPALKTASDTEEQLLLAIDRRDAAREALPAALDALEAAERDLFRLRMVALDSIGIPYDQDTDITIAMLEKAKDDREALLASIDALDAAEREREHAAEIARLMPDWKAIAREMTAQAIAYRNALERYGWAWDAETEQLREERNRFIRSNVELAEQSTDALARAEAAERERDELRARMRRADRWSPQMGCPDCIPGVLCINHEDIAIAADRRDDALARLDGDADGGKGGDDE